MYASACVREEGGRGGGPAPRTRPPAPVLAARSVRLTAGTTGLAAGGSLATAAVPKDTLVVYVYSNTDPE